MIKGIKGKDNDNPADTLTKLAPISGIEKWKNLYLNP